MRWFHFEIGWLNLWVLTLVYFLTPYLISTGKRGKAGLKRQLVIPSMSKTECVFYMLVMLPRFVQYLYTIFVPLTANPILLSMGLALFVIGLVLILRQTWDYAAAPPNYLITTGVYQISRHPGYFGAALIYLGLGLAGGSGLIAAFAICFFIGYQWVATLEERFCKEHWPEEFAEYKRKVAKNFLFF